MTDRVTWGVALAVLLGACGGGEDVATTSAAASSARPSSSAATSVSAGSSGTTTTVDPAASAGASASAAPSASVRAEPGCAEGMALVGGGLLSTMERGRDVEVGAFCMDLREVTVKSFRGCVIEGGCKRECEPGKECPQVPIETRWDNTLVDTDVSRFCNGRGGAESGKGRFGKVVADASRDAHPVNCVSYGEARGFCEAQGKRLPTGDEWEWASRGGPAKLPSPWGSTIVTSEICWGKPKMRTGTCEEGAYPKDLTPQGLVDMGGNVSEWTSAPARGMESDVVRWVYGASWYATDDGYARAALGGVQMPARRAETVGFRCASAPR